MPHITVVSSNPHPENTARTMTLHGNTDCPRCGFDLGAVYSEPDDLVHCPSCGGPLVNHGRMEDGGADRTANIHVFAWFAPVDNWVHSVPCDCSGCAISRAMEGR